MSHLSENERVEADDGYIGNTLDTSSALPISQAIPGHVICSSAYKTARKHLIAALRILTFTVQCIATVLKIMAMSFVPFL
eukprot:13438713-Ditylum_brightwellii.AAC.1